jgi:hypothetical protein
MATNYTPLDLKKWGSKAAKKDSKGLNVVLAGIGIVTVLVLLTLLYMLYKKSSGI